MKEHLIILVIVWPLLAGVLTSLLPAKEKLLAWWGVLNLLLCNAMSLALTQSVLRDGVQTYHISGWAPPMGIELKVTLLSSLLSCIISCIALLGFLGGRCTWASQIGERLPHFLALWFLLVSAFQGLSLSNDAFNLYVMLEISSLATYGLIAFGGGRAYLATFHYIVMGTIGASFYLLGVGYLYIKTGTLNISDLALIISQVELSVAYRTALAFIVIGLLLKMAVFPLHRWLPNAYTFAPAATSILVAPLSTKLAVFLMFRVLMDLFAGKVPTLLPHWATFMVLLASVGILAGTSLALAQRDLKQIFSCLIVAEAGYMLGGLWLSDPRGSVGALFHLVNDSVATLALFLVAIAVHNAMGGRKLEDLGGLFKRSPLTAAALVIVAFNLIGVPPCSGFFSKVTLLTGAFASGHYEFVLALLLASLGNLVIFFRILEHAYFEQAASSELPESAKQGRTGELLAFGAAMLLIVLGLNSYTIMTVFISPVVIS